MTKPEAVNWIINLMADIGKSEHSELWHYEQALTEIKEMLESEMQVNPCTICQEQEYFNIATERINDARLN